MFDKGIILFLSYLFLIPLLVPLRTQSIGSCNILFEERKIPQFKSAFRMIPISLFLYAIDINFKCSSKLAL